ncbi:hypothetical protein Nepgr_020925 [Nepenthes gracilis]|uniref:Uncharacterized protein n=1 Tax=Nepenthes gracilis TaxID=150966 RepID=A0AAD3SYM5_NEPGR|nr:hypothetical protein Nepgr_020925 [Nepenthes gracilis]
MWQWSLLEVGLEEMPLRPLMGELATGALAKAIDIFAEFAQEAIARGKDKLCWIRHEAMDLPLLLGGLCNPEALTSELRGWISSLENKLSTRLRP